MTNDARFWRNASIIAVVHIAVLGGLARWNSHATKSAPAEIVWIEGGADGFAQGAVEAGVSPAAAGTAAPTTAPPPPDDQGHAEDLTAVKSEIQLPTETPLPTPEARPSPTAAPKPSPTPKAAPSATPKSSPTPTRKQTPKPSPSASPRKKLLAKAEPTPRKNTDSEAKPADKSEAEAIAPQVATERPSAAGDGATVTVKPTAGGSGGAGAGPGGASQLRSYSRVLHDRFYKEWEQPTSVVAAGAKMSAHGAHPDREGWTRDGIQHRAAVRKCAGR